MEETPTSLDAPFKVIQMVKNLPAMQETWVQSLGLEGALEKDRAQSLTGRGAGAAPSLAARSRAGAAPVARLLSIPPTEPSGAAEAARGKSAPRGSGPGRWDIADRFFTTEPPGKP